MKLTSFFKILFVYIAPRRLIFFCCLAANCEKMEEYKFDNILVLKDLKTVPDIVYEYTAKDQKSPLIIDNGSFQCRVGFAHRKSPQLVFKNLVGELF